MPGPLLTRRRNRAGSTVGPVLAGQHAHRHRPVLADPRRFAVLTQIRYTQVFSAERPSNESIPRITASQALHDLGAESCVDNDWASRSSPSDHASSTSANALSSPSQPGHQPVRPRQAYGVSLVSRGAWRSGRHPRQGHRRRARTTAAGILVPNASPGTTATSTSSRISSAQPVRRLHRTSGDLLGPARPSPTGTRRTRRRLRALDTGDLVEHRHHRPAAPVEGDLHLLDRGQVAGEGRIGWRAGRRC